MWSVWNGFLLGKAKREDVPCRFCGQRDGDGHSWGSVLFFPSSMSEIFLSLLHLRHWIAATGQSGSGDEDPWASSFG